VLHISPKIILIWKVQPLRYPAYSFRCVNRIVEGGGVVVPLQQLSEEIHEQPHLVRLSLGWCADCVHTHCTHVCSGAWSLTFSVSKAVILQARVCGVLWSDLTFWLRCDFFIYLFPVRDIWQFLPRVHTCLCPFKANVRYRTQVGTEGWSSRHLCFPSWAA
jgi:hypothetical protein